MTALLVAIGIALILFTLRDVVHELFHPSGTGSIGRRLMRLLWRGIHLLARWRPSALNQAGPTILLSVVITWTILVATGWALIYWPFLPEGFRFASPLSGSTQDGFLDALYLSLTALATLGFGDITPTTAPLRFAATIQGLVGFAILTAAISWILNLYPVLTRRRAFANRIHLLDAARDAADAGLDALPPDDAARLLDDLAAQLTMLRADVMLSPLSYYFHDEQRAVALAPALVTLHERVSGLGPFEHSGARHARQMLLLAIDGYAEVLARQFLGPHGATTEQVLHAYDEDHPHPDP